MTLASTRDLIDRAVTAASAVPAINVISLDSAEAIVAGAERAGVGVLLQVSENAIAFRGSASPILAACAELALGASVPIGIHVDHVVDLDLVTAVLSDAQRLGVGSIMIDASEQEFDRNLEVTADVAARAHAVGLWVEAELGEIGGKDGAHAPGVRTDPTDAADFVARTGVDGLAVAVGSSHAMTERTASLDVELIASIAAAVPVPLVLHGSSGVPDAEVRAAVRAGIRKVNVGTALNAAWTATLRRELGAQPEVTDPRRYDRAARDAVADVVAVLCGVIAG